MASNNKNLYWTQLRTLIWKNFALKRRSWLFLLLELFWPLVLFIIIVYVRVRRPAIDRPSCHLRPKALPSAGYFPFLQTFLCGIDNKCSTYPPEVNLEQDSDLNRLVDTYSKLLNDEDFMEDLQWVIDSDAQQLISAGGLFKLDDPDVSLSDSTKDVLERSRLNVFYFLPSADDDAQIDLSSGFNANTVLSLVSLADEADLCNNEGKLTNLVLYPLDLTAQNRSEVELELCSLTSAERGTLITPLYDTVDYFTSIQAIVRLVSISSAIMRYDVVNVTMVAFQDLQQMAATATAEDGSLTNVFSAFMRFTCGLSSLGGLLSAGGGDGSTLDDTAANLGLSASNNYQQDPEFSEQCNSLFETFEGNLVTENLWRYMKPIIIGKIYFTPDTEASWDLVRGMNETFEALDRIFDAVTTIIDARTDLYQQLFDYFEAPTDSDLPFLDMVVGFAPILLSFAGINQTTDEFFSNSGLNGTWQDLFNQTFDVLEDVNLYFACLRLDRFEAFSDEGTMIETGSELLTKGKVWAGIVFTNIEAGMTEVPKHVNYKLRMNTDRVDSTDRIIDRVWFPDPRVRALNDLKPYTSGQIFLLDILEKAIIKHHAGEENSDLNSNFKCTGTWLKQFPSPCYKEDQFLYAISRTIPLFMTLAWLFSVGMIVKGIVYEKETRLKEVMKIMRLGNSMLWTSWFITTFMLLFTAAVILSCILKFGNVLANSNLLLVVLMFVSFVFPTITFCFLVSTFFSKANLASACAGIAFFCTYLPYTLYLTWERYITSNAVKYGLCLFSNVAFGFACSYFAYFEQQGTGVQFDNINTSPNYNDDYSLLEVIMMMYLDAVLYLLLALYIEQVFPGTYGVPKKFYFLFQKSYWLGQRVARSTTNEAFDVNFKVFGKNFESEPANQKIGVQIKNMTKIYATGNKLAVDGLSINFYQNQITSFLGHNGAGKTTTLSIITGLFSPTKGTAFVDGMDIRENMDEIRRSVGMCPQYNVLFDNLTVSEHLYFYGKLRGRSEKEIVKETVKLLQDLNLPHKANTLSKNLSGGMKRKLSVAISFVGNNKTVILDEPTAGVDPFSRRGIWELLTKYKEGRTIILSTHHMDEADVLGDRIAIIASGKLQCVGTSMFLRRQFGNGYLLTIVTQPTYGQDSMSTSSGSSGTGSSNGMHNNDKHQNQIRKFVEAKFSDATLSRNLGQEMTFVLPYKGLEEGDFLLLFEELRSNMSSMGISDYGLSDTSLEEIFIKVADQAPESAEVEGIVPKSRFSFRKRKRVPDTEVAQTEENGYMKEAAVGETPLDSEFLPKGYSGEAAVEFKDADRSTAKNFATINVPKVSGLSLMWLQFCALYIKRFHHIRKDAKSFFTQILLPALFVFLAMFSSAVLPKDVDQPNLELQPWIYGDDHWVFFSDTSEGDSLVKRRIDDFLVEQPHHSTRCMDGYSISEHACYPNIESDGFSVWDTMVRPSPKCSCNTGYQVCEEPKGGGDPPEKKLATTDRLQDLTSRNISDYLLKTRMDYRLQRFYGFEFEGEASDFFVTQEQLVWAIANIEDFIKTNGWLQQNYSSGFSWNAVMQQLRESLNSTLSEDHVKVWWNNKAHHGMLSAVNAMHNVLLRSSLPNSVSGSEKHKYGITANSHPWSLTMDQRTEAVLIRSGRDLLIGICVIFAMSFIPASFILYLIDERVSKSKHLQYVSGVNPSVFWISTAAWDFTNYLFPCLLCILIFIAFQAESYVSSDNLPVLCLLLLMYGWSVTPVMYPACYLFDIPSTAYVLLTGINAFIGINATTATYILDFFPDDEDLTSVNVVLKKVFLIFPQYCLGRGLFEMALNQLFADQLSQFGEYKFKSPLNYDIAGKHILFMMIQGIVMFVLLLVVEHVYVFRRLFVNQLQGKEMRKGITAENTSTNIAVNGHGGARLDHDRGGEEEEGAEKIEEDVMAENWKVMRGYGDGDPVVVKKLRKVYRTNFRKSLVAVNDLSFSVPKGECFGLLGVNGAGKTSTFNMLTGDYIPSSGQAKIGGFDIVTDLNSARKKVGFCPQFDALDLFLTVREHVELYARLRGIENENVHYVAECLIEKMGLKKYTNKQAGTLSGGNKRKLSTAIALVGDPQIIFLDEPTSGMDPKARRYLWQCIHDAISEGRSVVLTSHSMEECEALCTRLAIMVNGHFKCLGSTQHIKTKYGDGYVIQIKMPHGCCEEVERLFLERFVSAQITERLSNLLVFQLPQKDSSLGDLFKTLELNKKTPTERADGSFVYLIEDYSVSQTTLDQVFINFASYQSDDTKISNEPSGITSIISKLVKGQNNFRSIKSNNRGNKNNQNSRSLSNLEHGVMMPSPTISHVNTIETATHYESQSLLESETPVARRNEGTSPTSARLRRDSKGSLEYGRHNSAMRSLIDCPQEVNESSYDNNLEDKPAIGRSASVPDAPQIPSRVELELIEHEVQLQEVVLQIETVTDNIPHNAANDSSKMVSKQPITVEDTATNENDRASNDVIADKNSSTQSELLSISTKKKLWEEKTSTMPKMEKDTEEFKVNGPDHKVTMEHNF